MVKTLPAIAFLFLALPLFADWGAHGLTPVSTGPSSLEGGTKYLLKDAKGRTFYVNSLKEPDDKVITRIVAYKDEFYSWKQVRTRELSFYLYEKGIQAVLVPTSITHRKTDLKPYLPAGFTFIIEKDTLRYRYRIIVGTTSLKLAGVYTGEEPLLDELLAYVRGIKEKKIIVEDEKVISGSVVSFTSEKKKGELQVHPVGDLPKHDRDYRSSYRTVPFVTAEAGVLWPMGHMGEMLGPGLGGIVSYRTRGHFLDGLEAGIEAGFYYMLGKDSMEEENQKTDRAFFAPFTLYGGYRVALPKNIVLTPFVSAGIAFFDMKYTSRDRMSFAVKDKSVQDTDPVANGGLLVSYTLNRSFTLLFRCSFGYMVGSDGGMYLVSNVGAAYRL